MKRECTLSWRHRPPSPCASNIGRRWCRSVCVVNWICTETVFQNRTFPQGHAKSVPWDVNCSHSRVHSSWRLKSMDFYYYDKNPTFLMGLDLISAAALIIDPVNRCVWSKITASTPPAPQQSTHFSASVPSFLSLLPAAEDFDSDDSDSDASPPPSPPPPSPVSPSVHPLHSGVVRRLWWVLRSVRSS